MLDRIGRVVVRRHLAVVVVALVVVAVAGVFGGGVQSKLSHGGFDDPSAESTGLPPPWSGTSPSARPNLILIAGSDQPVDSAGVADAGLRLTQAAAGQPGVLAVESYWTVGRPATLRSRNRREALAGDEEQAAVRAGTLVPTLRGLAGPLRIQAARPGPGRGRCRTQADLQKAEFIAAPITLVLLVLVSGSAIAAALPLVLAGLSVVTTLAVLHAIAAVTPVSVYLMNIMTALGLAMDCSLFIVTRFRENSTRGATSRRR